MAIKIKVDHDIGDTLYIKYDPEQLPHTLVGVVVLPGAIKYILSYLGEQYTVYNFEATKDHDPSDKKEDDE